MKSKFRYFLENGAQLPDLKDLVTYDLHINEAAFNASKIGKVADLYAKIMAKSMKGKFNRLNEIEYFSRKMGKGAGIRYMNNAGEMIRFNYDEKLGKTANNELTSIDYWSPKNTDFQKPSRTVTFGSADNVVQILDLITDALLTGKINEAQEIIDNANLLLEAPSAAEKQAWLKSKGLPKSLAGSKSLMKMRAEEVGLGEELEVFLGQSEKNSFENGIKEVENQFAKEVFADPETVFEDIEDLLSVVASKKWRTLIVCGMGGVGKTWHITEGPRSLPKLLGPVGEKWTYHSGTKVAPFAFYKTLFMDRNKVIVFDEADSILKNEDIIMMLKPILDTSGDNMAAYMSGTKNMLSATIGEIEEYSQQVDDAIRSGANIATKESDNTVVLPSKFQFTGSMIFISNLRANKIDQAIMSRSIFIDVYLAQQDVVKRIKSIAYAQAKSEGLASEEVDDILEALSGPSAKGPEVEVTYMTPEYARSKKDLTVRAYQLAKILKTSGLSRWADLASLYA